MLQSLARRTFRKCFPRFYVIPYNIYSKVSLNLIQRKIDSRVTDVSDSYEYLEGVLLVGFSNASLYIPLYLGFALFAMSKDAQRKNMEVHIA